MNNEYIIKMFEDEGVKQTDKVFESIYILSDGRMISGMFDCGIRGVDHRIIESLFLDMDRNTPDFWDEVVARTNILMFIPENKVVLKKQRQKLSESQEKIIKEHNLKVEEF